MPISLFSRDRAYREYGSYQLLGGAIYEIALC